MKTARIILACLCVTVVLTGVVEAQEWRGIIPLKSTRADVERLFGFAEKSYGVVYQLEDGNLSIEYSTGLCTEDRQGGWNVPEDTVISFTFSAKAKQLTSELKLDRSKFKRVKDRHVGVIYYYINAEEGVMYTAQRGEVDSVEYYPAKKYNHLYCGDPSDVLQNGKSKELKAMR